MQLLLLEMKFGGFLLVLTRKRAKIPLSRQLYIPVFYDRIRNNYA